ncbi:MAG: hypothetical protein ACI4NB_03765 [Candidatus Ornithospirochaeta sp.]
MSFDKSELNPKAYEQWDLWRNGVFGGLPWEAILSSVPLVFTDKGTSEIEGELFLLTSLKSNIYLPEDENEKITIPDKIYSPMFDGQVQYQQDLFFEEDYLACSMREIFDLKNYHITEQSVAIYLENYPVKEELKESFAPLVSIICDFLNRDKKRMESAQEYIIRRKELIDSKNAKSLFQESFNDRASTIAQIEGFSSISQTTQQTEENATAGQESTTESKIETQSIEPPEEIQKLFEPFVKERELILSDGAIDGKRRYFLTFRNQSSFAVHVKEMSRTKGWIEIAPKTMKEWIYKREGKPYSRDFYSE